MRPRRHRQAVVLQLIEQAYAAAETPHLWETFLHSLAESVNGTGAVLHHDVLASGAANVGVCGDPAVVAHDEQLISAHAARWTEHRDDFAGQVDATRLLTVMLGANGGTNTRLTILRGECDAPFEYSDRRFVSTIVPHLERALQLYHRLADGLYHHAVALEAFDVAPCALFLVNADAKIMRANRRGLAMLTSNDGLSFEGARLSAANPRETTRLRNLCLAVADTQGTLRRDAGGAMAVSRPRSEHLLLQVVVAPAPAAETLRLHDDRVTAVVFVSDPSEERAPSEALLRQAYALTPAESHVAVRIAVGRTLAEIAAERGSALETVRRQTKQILAKTGARRRSELVRLLSTTVLPASDNGPP